MVPSSISQRGHLFDDDTKKDLQATIVVSMSKDAINLTKGDDSDDE